jgi:hypothetical protein
MIDLRSLPIFPCDYETKRPMTPHGFYDAKIGADYSGWPLVGLRTGAASGIDVLDVDPAGLAWLAQVEHQLPGTRRHRTRRGGVHILFRHANGLRKSENRIAAGVDVRADGAYAVWWPRESYPVIDVPLAEWPGWLLALARPRGVVVVRRAYRERVSRPRTGAFSLHATHAEGEPTRHLRARVRAVLRVVERARPGGRNNALIWASCRLAEVVAERRLSVGVAAALLEGACRVCDLWRDDGPAQCRATIASGFATIERAMLAEPQHINGAASGDAPSGGQHPESQLEQTTGEPQ